MSSIRVWSRTPLFWIALSSICFSGLFFTYNFFPKAFAILNIRITMNREQALEKAAALGHIHQWGPENYQAAAAFRTDEETKNFIELEGGGTQRLNEIIKEKWYSPYYWIVRHFKEFDAHETEILFTPEGTFYGVSEKLPEDAPGAALTPQQALAIARENALNWQIDLSSYTFAQSSQEIRPSGRIDHEFVYDRTGHSVNGAPFQLHLGMSGDRLTEIKYEIKVPESFKRRYEHMRSANNIIAFGALFLICILYLGIGCLAGLAFLLARHSLLWKPALVAGFLVALLQSLNTLNELPLAWMEYETALSKTSFFIHLFTALFASLLVYTGALTLVFSIAEGLTRYAFGNHLKLWSIWRTENASSLQVLGRTLGGYLIIGADIAYVTAAYAFTTRFLGWWTPAETLFNPNILATYFPWFSALSQSLMAGFMEECLFRAIPLAGAALLGSYFRRRNLFISLGFIIQVLIFGAGHANYPQQPAYARVVELIFSSSLFGGIYLIYGLLPSILSHVIFDVFWMGLPLFISTGAGTFINKALVVLISSIPLLIVLYARLKNGAFTQAPVTAYNKSLQPEPKQKDDEFFIPEDELPRGISGKEIRLLAASGVIAAFGWLFFTPFKQQNLPLHVGKTEALSTASAMLTHRGFSLSNPPWQTLINTHGETDEHDRFVIQKNGKEVYTNLLGSYITPASWKLRFAQFEGDIAERSEEFGILLEGSGKIREVDHALPEARPGASLSEAVARKKAHEIIRNEFNLDPSGLQEISAVSKKRPERIDWVFTFKDPHVSLNEGEARIKISLAGDQFSNAERFIFIPEQWTRAEKQSTTIIRIIGMICSLLALIGLSFFMILLLKNWRRFAFSPTIFFIFAALLALKALIQSINIWPLIIACFQTSEPYSHQAIKSVGWLMLQIISQGLYYGAGAALATTKMHNKHVQKSITIFTGICCGLILSAMGSLSFALAPIFKPLWADYTHAASLIPSVGFALTMFTGYVSATIVFLLITRFADLVTAQWKQRSLAGFFLIILLVFCINGLSIESIGTWLLPSLMVGGATAVLYYLIVRHIRSSIPVITATITILAIAQQAAFHAYPGVFLGSVLGIVLIGMLAYWWEEKL
ncbi:MAG TPA: CPBP family intramembrane glutamic endopeptidase [Candidatus Babeliales bacterium]|nr:CPBP family intramembrane glutamic endopeptidase [Candidatus Babeliales bacterium]